MLFKSKRDWLVLTQTLTCEELLEDTVTFIKPTGHLYMLGTVDGKSTLMSKDKYHIDDPISKELVSLGYKSGPVVLESIESKEKPKSWLNHYLDNNDALSEELLVHYEDKLRIHVFGECADSNIYNIQRTMPTVAVVGDVEDINIQRGGGDSGDGLLVSHRGIDYHLLPSRTIKGVIRSVEEDSLIVLFNIGGSVIPALCRWGGDNPPTKDIIGCEATAKYTKMLGNEHVNPLLCPVVYEERVKR